MLSAAAITVLEYTKARARELGQPVGPEHYMVIPPESKGLQK